MQLNLIQTKLYALSVSVVLALSVSGCGDSTYISGSSSVAPPITEKTQISLKKSVDDYMTYVAQPAGVPGAIVAVKMNGYQPWYYATGSAEINVADNTQKTAMKPEMPFRIASITKMFIAHAVILLAQEGKIDLTKSVEYYLPDALTGLNAGNANKITINMLLNHTSGIYSYVTSDAGLLKGNGPTAGLPMNTFVKNLGQTAWAHSILPQDDVLKFVNTFSPPVSIKIPNGFNNLSSSVGKPYLTNPYFAPGSDIHYSNTNYYLLGLLIEKVSNSHNVATELKRLITDPLGLSDTYLPTAKMFSNPAHVHGYTDYFNNRSYLTAMDDALLKFHWDSAALGWVNGDGKLEDFTDIDPSFTWTTGGIISSAKDLLTFTEYVMKSRVQSGQEAGKWVLGAPLDLSTTFQYGRGIARINDVMFGHGGQFAGYNSAVYWYAPLDIYFLVMTNKYSYIENDPNDIGGSIVMGADGLYKPAAKTAHAIVDPDTAIINGLLGALEQDAAVVKSMKKAGITSFRFPDVSSQMQ
ncbi:MAG: serine hydrolase domain-containing protein [Desulfuromonadales bacterium]